MQLVITTQGSILKVKEGCFLIKIPAATDCHNIESIKTRGDVTNVIIDRTKIKVESKKFLKFLQLKF